MPRSKQQICRRPGTRRQTRARLLELMRQQAGALMTSKGQVWVAPQRSDHRRPVTPAEHQARLKASKILRSKETNRINFLKGEEIGARLGLRTDLFYFAAIAASISLTAISRPTKIDLEIMWWPMLNSVISGIAARAPTFLVVSP